MLRNARRRYALLVAIVKKLWLLLILAFPALGLGQVVSTSNQVNFTCTGTVGPYPFTWPSDVIPDIVVYQTAIGSLPSPPLTPTAQYTVSPVNNSYING